MSSLPAPAEAVMAEAEKEAVRRTLDALSRHIRTVMARHFRFSALLTRLSGSLCRSMSVAMRLARLYVMWVTLARLPDALLLACGIAGRRWLPPSGDRDRRKAFFDRHKVNARNTP